MLKIVLCDDNEILIHELHTILDKYFADKQNNVVIKEYFSGEKLLESETGLIDIAFLDVEMQDINGIQVGYEIQKRNPNVYLFIVTSYSKYLDDAMDLKVFRYLDKPISIPRLFRGLDIAIKEKKTIKFMSKHTEIELNEDEIVCIYTSLRKISVLTDTGEIFTTNLSIKEWLNILKGSTEFSSPHYSYIVNLKYVSEINNDKITVQCKNGEKMYIYASQRKLIQFKRDFYNKMREYR